MLLWPIAIVALRPKKKGASLSGFLLCYMILVCSMLVYCSDSEQWEPGRRGLAITLCQGEDAAAISLQPAGMVDSGIAIAPGGRKLTPAGRLVTVGYFPLAVRIHPELKVAYVVHSKIKDLDVIDLDAAKLIQVVDGVGGFRGIALDLQSSKLFVGSVHKGLVTVFDIDEKGILTFDRSIKIQGAPTELNLAPEGLLIVISGSNSRVWEISTANFEIKREYETRGVYPYASVLIQGGKLLAVTHVGDDNVTFIDRQSGDVVKTVNTGLNPMGLVASPGGERIYVADSDSDTITIIDANTLEKIKAVDVSGIPGGLPGGSPNELAITLDGGTLLVSMADLNRVELYNTHNWHYIGAIPTAFYPTGLALCPDDSCLVMLSSKGWGGALSLKDEPSIVSILDWPIPAQVLAQLTQIAEENVQRTDEFWPEPCMKNLPLPLDPDKPQVIRHVVLIVRENKTYDAVLGDFERGNGDPQLVVFGEQYTPNLHELARQFVNMDNFYHDAQESFQGHTWTTQADCNDFFEKLYPADFGQIVLGGFDPSTITGEKTFFDHCFENAVSFRNYGEFEGFAGKMMDLYHEFIDFKFPFYNLSIPDVWKAEEFIRELNLGIFPEFVYIALPNDHTAGGKVGMPTPGSMVADNDEATGMIVDAISRSPFWENTVIFIIEDDPQGYGGDHVHSHRSVCVVVSPWVRRGYTSSVHYSIPSLYRTIEMLLRMPPMRKNDAFAAPMYDIFVSGDGEDAGPDYSPFTFIPRLIPVEFNTKDSPMAKESEMLDFSRPDRAQGLGYIIWRIMKGSVEPPPYAKWRDK